MSQYHFKSDKNYDVCIGWDNPLQSFFASITDPNIPEDENNLIDSIGWNFEPIKSLNELQSRIIKHVKIPEDIALKLEQDCTKSHKPISLQQYNENLSDIL